MTTPLRLLIVDDDAGIRNQLKWIFEDYDVYTAGDFRQAVEQFEKYRPQLVTLDLGLPPDADGVNEGYRFLRFILEKVPDTKVIVVSGADREQNKIRAAESGAFHFSSKPIDAEQLVTIAQEACRGIL